MLARREAMPDNRAVDWSWLNRPSDSPAIQGDTVPAGAAVPHAALAIAGSQDDSMLRANNDVPAGKAA
jgi:hypothetical protein